MNLRPTATAYRVAWLLLLLLAAALRLPHADWDGGLAVHPDERYLLQVAERLAPAFPGVNPCREEANFPYGLLPLAVATVSMRVVGGPAVLYTVRLLAALSGVALVAVAGGWGAALGGPSVALLAAGLLAVAPFPLQQARFLTVDPFAALFSALALLAAARSRPGLAGVSAAAAVASKATLALLFPILWLYSRHARTATRMTAHFAVALALFAPWMALTPWACLRGPLLQSAILNGRYEVPYVWQFVGNPRYLYPLWQMALWGLGPTVVLAGLVGMGRALSRWVTLTERAALALAWVLIYTGLMGRLLAQFPRYYLPLYPLWTAWAAWAVWTLPRRGRVLWGGAVLLVTALLGAAQLGVYTQPHPYVRASAWLVSHLPAGSVIANEHWDDPLPQGERAGQYPRVKLPVMEAESPEKLAALDAALAQVQAVVLATPRGYGVIGRMGMRFPQTRAWYARLLSSPAYTVLAFGRCPRLGPLALSDDPLADAGLPQPLSLAQRCGTPYALRLPRLDESFRVYDAPQTLVLVRP